jgi:hypothetical protein
MTLKRRYKMKLLKNRLAVLIMPFVFLTISFSFSKGAEFIPSDKDAKKEANYISALNSNNESLRINSAYKLGEIKSKKAVIPLMDMFRLEKDDGAKLVAALSLLKIGDARGVFLIKRSIELKENDGLKIMLQHLFKDYGLKNSQIFD